jgi:glycosyltransferase involved in cell wall biosynthesis
MKILLSSAGFFPHSFGGGQIYVYRLGRELKRRGHDVTVVTTGPWNDGKSKCIEDDYEYNGLSVRALAVNPQFVRLADSYSQLNPVLLEGLKNILIETNPGIVHLNGLKPALTSICHEHNIPYIVTSHHAGFVCPAGTLLTQDDLFCDKVARPEVCVPCCSRIKLRDSLLGPLLGNIPGLVNKPIGRMLNRFKNIPYIGRGLMYPWLIEERMRGLSIVLKNTKFIIAPSKAMKELLVKNGVSSDKIVHIPHGIEPLLSTQIEQGEGSKIRFGYIGRIDRSKGFHILSEALEKFFLRKNCELHVFGGPQTPWDKEYMDRCLSRYHGETEIISHGYISADQLSEAYKQIDVLIVPSICFEVFGLIVLEAFSAGRPVIVSRAGGPEELVGHGLNGFVVQRNDSKSLAEAMQRFVDDPELVYKMASCVPRVKTIQEYVDEMESVYVRVVSQG